MFLVFEVQKERDTFNEAKINFASFVSLNVSLAFLKVSSQGV